MQKSEVKSGITREEKFIPTPTAEVTVSLFHSQCRSLYCRVITSLASVLWFSDRASVNLIHDSKSH